MENSPLESGSPEHSRYPRDKIKSGWLSEHPEWLVIIFTGMFWLFSSGFSFFISGNSPVKIDGAFHTQFEETHLYLPAAVHFSFSNPWAADPTGTLEESRISPLPVIPFAIMNLIYKVTGSASAMLVISKLVFVLNCLLLYYLVSHFISDKPAASITAGFSLLGLEIHNLEFQFIPLLVFAFGVALVIYFMARRFNKSIHSVSLCLVSFVSAWLFLKILNTLNMVPFQVDFYGARVISPAFAHTFFFLTALSFVKIFKPAEIDSRFNIPALLYFAVLLPLNFYVYFMNVFLLLPATGILFILVLWKNPYLLKSSHNIKGLIMAGVLGLGISIPFITMLLQQVLPGSQAYQDFATRASVPGVTTLLFEIKYWGWLAAGAVAVYFLRKDLKNNLNGFLIILWLVCIFDMFIVNLPVDNPIIPQVRLFRRYFPLLTIILVCQALFRSSPPPLKIFHSFKNTGPFFILMLMGALYGVFASGYANALNQNSTRERELNRVLSEISGTVKSGDIFVSDDKALNALAPVQLETKTFYTNPYITYASNWEILENYIYHGRILGFSPEKFYREVFKTDHAEEIDTHALNFGPFLGRFDGMMNGLVTRFNLTGSYRLSDEVWAEENAREIFSRYQSVELKAKLSGKNIYVLTDRDLHQKNMVNYQLLRETSLGSLYRWTP